MALILDRKRTRIQDLGTGRGAEASTKAYQAACYTEYEPSVMISATPSFMSHKVRQFPTADENSTNKPTARRLFVLKCDITWGSYQAYMERHHPDLLAWCQKNVRSRKTLHKLDDMQSDERRKGFAMKLKLINGSNFERAATAPESLHAAGRRVCHDSAQHTVVHTQSHQR